MNHDYFTKTQSIISFCTGYGGIELGLRGAGMDARAVCYVEIEAFAQANLVTKIEEGKMAPAPIWTDLKTFPSSMFSGKVDGIIGGYPCQPFSIAGKQLGSKDPRHLWPYIRNSIRDVRPRWCFFENVRGHVNMGLREVKHDLERLGYTVKAGIFSAEEVGASHRRERIFILGNSKHNGPHGAKKSGSAGKAIQGPKKREDISSESKGTGSSRELAYSDSKRREMCPGSSRLQSQFPMPPGSGQFTWENPRTTESGMGCTIDGFKARVDQLRLLGNGVVPQTVTKAFLTLSQ